jgi:hypothetical protein
VLPQHGLDPWVISEATLAGTEGTVLQVAPEVPPSLVRAHVVHSLLGRVTSGRATKEDRHMLLDGLSVWWATRGNEDERALWWLRAASLSGPVTSASLLRWDETRERLGQCQSYALSFAAVDTLISELGEGTSHALFGELFNGSPKHLGVLFEPSPSELLERRGQTWERLAEHTEKRRVLATRRWDSLLSKRPKLAATVSVSTKKGRGTAVEVGLSGCEAYWALYELLEPWSAGVVNPARLDLRGVRGVLPLSLPRKARLFTALEVDDPILECPVRVHAERLELP